MSKANTWVCIACGRELGVLIGQELAPHQDTALRTQGSNLLVTCPSCHTRKTWYPADPLVRVLRQLIDVIASEMSRAAVRGLSKEVSQLRQSISETIGENNDE